MEIAKGKIGNALTSTAKDHVVAVANDLYDEDPLEVDEDYQPLEFTFINDLPDLN